MAGKYDPNFGRFDFATLEKQLREDIREAVNANLMTVGVHSILDQLERPSLKFLAKRLLGGNSNALATVDWDQQYGAGSAGPAPHQHYYTTSTGKKLTVTGREVIDE